MYYKLDENKNVISSSLEEWSTFIAGCLPTNYKHVGDNTVKGKRISTVFIGMCQDFDMPDKAPIVFETMIFDDGHAIYQYRYSTWEEAEEGHKKAVQWVKDGCKELEE